MIDKREVCGTCEWHGYSVPDDDWMCENSESDYWQEFTEYRDSCDEWEKRE